MDTSVVSASWFPSAVRSPDDRFAVDFGAWLAEARRLGHYSQQALGDRVGVSQSTISRLEHGLVPGATLRTVAPILILLRTEFGDVARRPRIRPGFG